MSRAIQKIGTFMWLTIGAVALSLGVAGCNDGKDAVVDEAKGDTALAQGDYVDAIQSFQTALSEAQKADAKARKSGGSFDTAPYQQKLDSARQAASAAAKTAVDQAKALAATDPYAAKAQLDRASTLANARNGNSAQVTSQVNEVYSEPDMLPARIAAQMDLVTDAINRWLLFRSWYDDSTYFGSFWTFSNYLEMENQMSVLSQMLASCTTPSCTQAAAQLVQMRSALEQWRIWQLAALYGDPNTPVFRMMNAQYMITFLNAQTQLAATLHGAEAINAYWLYDYWGVNVVGGTYIYYPDSYGYYNGHYGYSSTGNGGANPYYGSSSTGNGGTSNGGGYSNTGGGDSSSGGSGSTGNGGSSGGGSANSGGSTGNGGTSDGGGSSGDGSTGNGGSSDGSGANSGGSAGNGGSTSNGGGTSNGGSTGNGGSSNGGSASNAGSTSSGGSTGNGGSSDSGGTNAGINPDDLIHN